MPTKITRSRPTARARRSAAPVKSPTSTKHTSARSGSSAIAPFSVRPPVHSTIVRSPWAAITDTACSTLARHDAVENGRTIPVVPSIEMPPRMPRRALVVLLAIFSPPGTERSTTTPWFTRSVTSATAWVIIARGVAVMAGSPTSMPRPGLVTMPTPSPPSRRMPGSARQRTVAVRCAPWVTSGSSPASLTTTAVAFVASCTQDSTSKLTRLPLGRATSTVRWVAWSRSAVAAALAAADAQVPVVQPVRSALGRTLAVRGRSGSVSSGSPRWPGWVMARPRALLAPPSRFAPAPGQLVPPPRFAPAPGLRPPPRSRVGGTQFAAGLRLCPAAGMEMAGVVQVRAGAAGRERGPDQEQRVLPQLAGSDRLGQGAHGALHEQFVRPGRPVGHQHRRVRRVATVEQVGLKLRGSRRRQEHRHRGAVPGEAGDLLPGGHRGLATAEPGEDHRLGKLGDGQLPACQRGDRGVGADPGNGLVRQAKPVAQFPLLLHRAPERGIAGVDAGHHEILRQGAFAEGTHGLQWQRGGVHDLRARPGVVKHLGLDQAGRPDHDVRSGDHLRCAQREQ